MDAAERLRRRVTGRVATDEPLGSLTTFRVGGRADLFVEAESVDDLVAVGELVRDGVPVAVVGRGSNLLVADAGFRGIALKLGRAFRVHEPMNGGLRLGGAVYLPAAARLTARLGLAGFEFAAEIPATFGGAVRMNAGAHDACIGDVLASADIVDLASGTQRCVVVGDLGYAYRRSSLGPLDVVIGGDVRLAPGDPDAVADRIAGHLRWRRAHQPPGRSAGSVFVNPDGDSAGRLIDAAGAKGLRVGGAEVSPMHANFIVASADARASDVWELIVRVRDMVAQRFGVVLQPEVRFLGDFGQ
jgi:UDP-N-acetylmuramate dehydrogenase